MATEPDPHRTLGLPPTATVAEIRAAYRRLAKANHPDAAGEAALPRFLAIQAAYERLVGPTPGRAKGAGTTSAPPRQPWQADPDRSNATHRAYGGRARRPASAGRSGSAGTATGSKGSAGSTGSGSGPSARSAPGSSSQADSGPGAAGASSTGRSGRPKKATLGSTSYDGVERETFEPDWGGANWYGTTSGTYWTINPKEYADPRKHGPEYQARARRAARAGSTGMDGDLDAPGSTALDGQAAAAPADPDAGATSGPDIPRHTTASWWESTSGPGTTTRDDAPDPARAAPRPRPTPPPRSTPSTPLESTPSLRRIRHALTVGAPPSIGWRVARAIIGWLPIGLAIGWASGELTGCGRFAATCDPGTAPIAWAAQAAVFLLLLALPTVAGWAVVAAAVSLIVAVPATLFVTASAGGAAAQAGTSFLGVVLALAWLGGAVAAAILLRRSTADRAGPVS